MIPPRALSRPALILAALGATSCTTGHQFSIAMANPGALQTVLVVGDDGSGSDATPAPAVPMQSLTAVAATSARATEATSGEAAVARSQHPATLDLGGAPANGVAAAVPTGAASAVQVAVNTPPVQLTVGAGVAGAPAAVPPVQVQLSSPVAVASASVAPGAGALGVQAATPVVSAALTASPATGLQASLTSPAAAPVVATVASITAPVQVTLEGVTSAVGLAAPVPRTSTPTASLLKTLTTVSIKKTKHS